MYTALRATSITLREFIRARLLAEPDINNAFAALGLVVSLNSPHELGASQGISVWLYRVERDPERLNAPPERAGFNLVRRDPLPLRLHYLVTPVVDPAGADSPETEQVLLGKVLQVLHDHPLLRGADLRSDFAGLPIELRVRLEPVTLEDISRIYNTLQRSYQLTVSYEVSVVYIESSQEPEDISPVVEVIPEIGVIVERNG